jgi:putative transferase (TIGR04331 family)
MRLASTAIEETWSGDEETLFLGDWCLRYSRRHQWEGLDFSVAEYHWDDRLRIPLDLAYVGGLYEAMLPKLARRLNDIHSVNYSTRYWRIVVGWWLFLFCQIFFDRWQMVQSAASGHPGLRMVRVPSLGSIPALPDMATFLSAISGDRWNERLYADIAEEWTEIEVTSLPLLLPESDLVFTEIDDDPPQRLPIRMRLLVRKEKLLGWVGHRSIFTGQRVSLQSDYLRRSERWKFQFLLHQMPSRSRIRRLPDVPARPDQRLWELPSDSQDLFECALAAAVPKHLPTCYLEGYSQASRNAETSDFPRRPRVVMTANAYSSDDRWKLWAARRCEAGAKLVVAQHGGHYGTGAWSATQMHEIAISDRYLSWGWADPAETRVCPAPATKLIGMERRVPLRAGRCLQVTASLPRQSYALYSVPVGPQVQDYIDDQLSFAGALSEEVRADLLVRLYPQDYGWDLAERWADAEPSIETDSGRRSISELLVDTRLYVATYNATTFLESFTQGIPTVMFWDPRYWELSADAQPRFDQLRRAGVLFDDPVSCARHVSAIWDDVPTWWSSPEVQVAVTEFCRNYAYVGPRPLRELKKALTQW